MRPTPDALIFSRAEALAIGWTDPALRRAVSAGRLHRLRPGLFTTGDPLNDPALFALAAVRACSGAVVSHRSAAVLHGLPVLRAARLPDVTVAPDATGDLSRAALHRARLWPGDVRTIRGAPVTSVARTVVDIARSEPLTSAIIPIDAALHAGAATTGQLEAVLTACWNWPGIHQAQRAIAQADGRSESPLESVSRVLMRAMRVPAPELQSTILDPHGRIVARADFYWPQFGVIGEADGRAKYDARDVLVAEKDRQERLEDLGLVVVRWGWADVSRRPHLVRDRLDRAFDRARARDRSGFPRHWSVVDR